MRLGINSQAGDWVLRTNSQAGYRILTFIFKLTLTSYLPIIPKSASE